MIYSHVGLIFPYQFRHISFHLMHLSVLVDFQGYKNLLTQYLSYNKVGVIHESF
jgi:hypothetical protein